MSRFMLPVLALLPITLAAQAPAKVRDSVQIAVAGPLRGEPSCKLWKPAIAPAGATNAVLIISLVDTLTTALKAAGTVSVAYDLSVKLDGRYLMTVRQGAGHDSVELPLKKLEGSIMTVEWAPSLAEPRLYCLVTMREPAAAGVALAGAAPAVNAAAQPLTRPDLYIATGAEFASADGFQSKQVRIPVVAKWIGEIYSDTGSRFAMTFASMGEAGAVAIPQHFTGCLPAEGVRVAVADTLSDDRAIATATCRVRKASRLTDGTYLSTPYVFVRDSIREDSTATTGLSWRLSGLLRFEWDVFRRNMYFGIPVFGAFETNPAGAFSRSIGQTWRTGFSFRQLDKTGIEQLQVLVLFGTTDVFEQSTTTTFVRPFVKSDSTTTSLVTRSMHGTQGWLIRGYFTPVDGFMLRAVVQADRRGGNLATIAILKTINVNAALKMFGME